MKSLSKSQMALACVSLGWFLVLAGRLSISTLLVNIEDSLGIGHAEAGLALTGMWLVYALMQFPSGIASDVRGRRGSILLAMTVFSLAYLLVGFSVSYLMFVFTLLLLGLGGGGFPTAGIAMITDLFKEKKGKALGLQSSAGSLAGVVPVFASIVALHYGWRIFFFVLAAVSFFSTYLFFRCAEESTRLPKKVLLRSRFVEGVAILREYDVLLIFLVNLTLTFAWIGFMSFFPAYLIEGKMLSEFETSVALMILATTGIFLKPFIGAFSDRFDKRLVLFVLSFFSAAATLFLVFTDSIVVVFVISFVLSSTSAAFPVISSYLTGRWEEKGRGGKLGFYRTLVILAGSPTSAVIGVSASRYGFDTSFLVLSVLLFMSSFVLLISVARNFKVNKTWVVIS
ncbi:MAG TPA: MFS transporter [Thermoplasmatales archaeon]|nr:MFS transporter [Thermoplasmatales archaeon]